MPWSLGRTPIAVYGMLISSFVLAVGVVGLLSTAAYTVIVTPGIGSSPVANLGSLRSQQELALARRHEGTGELERLVEGRPLKVEFFAGDVVVYADLSAALADACGTAYPSSPSPPICAEYLQNQTALARQAPVNSNPNLVDLLVLGSQVMTPVGFFGVLGFGSYFAASEEQRERLATNQHLPV